MNLKDFFKLKIVLFAIIAIIVTGFFGKAFALNNPVLWLTFIPSSPPGPGAACTLANVNIPFGWPLQFLKAYGTNGCEIDLLLNPISLLLNLGVFLIIGRIIFRKKTTIVQS